MTDQEYNRLVAALVGGLPGTLVITRLNLALRAAIEAGGDAAAAALREHVRVRIQRDEGDAESPFQPAPPTPKRR